MFEYQIEIAKTEGIAVAQEMNTGPSSEQTQDRELGHITYALYAIGILIGITPIAGVIIAHLKVSEAKGILKSHFQYLIRTFWIAFIGSIISMVLTMVFIGFFLLVAVAIWYIYRIVKGWLRYNDGKDIEDPTGWF